jgi:hypothetical protein
MTYYLHKVYFLCQNSTFVTAKSDQDPVWFPRSVPDLDADADPRIPASALTNDPDADPYQNIQ